MRTDSYQYCPNCSCRVTPGDSYCTHCGRHLPDFPCGAAPKKKARTAKRRSFGWWIFAAFVVFNCIRGSLEESEQLKVRQSADASGTYTCSSAAVESSSGTTIIASATAEQPGVPETSTGTVPAEENEEETAAAPEGQIPACPYNLNCSIAYSCMTMQQQAFYRDLYTAVRYGAAYIDIPEGMTTEAALQLTRYLRMEAPELCAFDWANCSYDSERIFLAYRHSLREQEEFLKYAQELVLDYRECAEDNGIMYIYGDVIQMLEYEASEDDGCYYAYETLLRGTGVCMGYAECVTMLCHFAGYRCSYVSGFVYHEDGTIGRHGWNLIGCYDGYTYIDATWDDLGSGAAWEFYGFSLADLETPREVELPAQYITLPEGQSWSELVW